MPRSLVGFNRVVANPVQRLWAPHLVPWVLLVHRGRRTGREYRTPVFATRHGGTLALAVLYGTRSDWVRNVLAAGEAAAVRAGRTLRLADPQLVRTDTRADLGWLGQMADHAVLARVVDGPGTRSFDPDRLGRFETDAWIAYYRRDWSTLLKASVGLVAEGFGMGRRRTLLGAWYVLRANQLWAPYPDNAPDAARECMRRFYALVRADGGLDLDPDEASRREVEWWRVHRVHQRESGVPEHELTAAVAHLYGYVYGVAEDSVHEAARLRVEAMRLSDEWVAAGCIPDSPVLSDERRLLIESYRALRAAVGAAPR